MLVLAFHRHRHGERADSLPLAPRTRSRSHSHARRSRHGAFAYTPVRRGDPPAGGDRMSASSPVCGRVRLDRSCSSANTFPSAIVCAATESPRRREIPFGHRLLADRNWPTSRHPVRASPRCCNPACWPPSRQLGGRTRTPARRGILAVDRAGFREPGGSGFGFNRRRGPLSCPAPGRHPEGTCPRHAARA